MIGWVNGNFYKNEQAVVGLYFDIFKGCSGSAIHIDAEIGSIATIKDNIEFEVFVVAVINL